MGGYPVSKTSEDYIKQQAIDYVNHYRDIIVTRLKKESVDIREFLNTVCDFSEVTYEKWEEDKREITGYYRNLGMSAEVITGKKLLARFRKDLRLEIYKEILTCLTDEVSELNTEISDLEETLTELNPSDQEDVSIIVDIKRDLSDAKAYVNNLHQMYSAIGSI
jgi:protein subunit release factor A